MLTKATKQQHLITNLPSVKGRNSVKWLKKQQFAQLHTEKTRRVTKRLAQHLSIHTLMPFIATFLNKAKWLGLVVLGVGLNLVGFGQVYEGSYTVTTQADIDNFNYVQIDGSLVIRGSDLVNVNGFETLERVNRELIIENNGQLQSVSGFNNLTKIGWLNTDHLEIKNNPNLLEISGFENLDMTTGHLRIIENNSLQTVNGFNSMKYVYELFIQNNQSLTTLNFLENLEIVDTRMYNENNVSLQFMQNFDKLLRLDNTFIFRNNDGVKKLSGFNNITKLNKIITIEQNNNLEHISGFANLSRLGVAGTNWDNHEIRYNPKLTNISGLANLRDITGELLIRDNASLSNCCPIFCNDSLVVSAGFTVNNNASTTEYSCNSESEGRNTCNEEEDCNFEILDTLCQSPVINNIDILNEECLLLNISVDDSCCTFLTKSNFTVYQNEIEQTIYDVLEPGDGGGVRVVDVVLVVDVSTSMRDEIELVKNNIGNFLAALDQEGDIDYAVGIITFVERTYAQNDGVLYQPNYAGTPPYQNIIEQVEKIRISGDFNLDDPENSLVALADASEFSFRQSSQKIMILLTDAIGKENPLTAQELVDQVLNKKNISVFPIFDTSDNDHIEQYGLIAEQTNSMGSYYNITADFSDIVSQISNQIVNTYLITTCSDQLNISDTTQLRVEIDCSQNDFVISETLVNNGCPTISLSQETAELVNAFGFQPNQDFEISIEITNVMTYYINQIMLFYKAINDESYSMTSMMNVEGDTWSAIIPESSLAEPGMNFFVRINYETCPTLNLPEIGNPPYQIGILPNEKPVIVHDTIREVQVGLPLEICADVTDETDSIKQVLLYFLEKPGIVFDSLIMTNTSDNIFCGTISGTRINCRGIDYYIYASDNYDLGGYDGCPENPHTFYPYITSIPTNLTASIVNAFNISLTWTDNSSGEENFIIERAISSEPLPPFNAQYKIIASTNNGITSYTDSLAIDINQNYWYRVRNENACDIGEAIYAQASLTNLCEALGCNCEDCNNCGATLGCTDPNFCEYNPEATCDDGSCQTPNTDPGTCQQDCDYDIYEIWNPSSCSCEFGRMNIKGCMDETAINYNPEANCEPEDICNYPNAEATFPCTILGTWQATDNCREDDYQPYETYTIDVWSLNNNTTFNFSNLFGFGFDVLFEAEIHDDQFVFPAQNFFEYTIYGTGSFTENADTINWQFSVAVDDTVSACTSTWVLESADGANVGCTDTRAINFTPDANCDDDSCIYDDLIPGCTDLLACNFSLNANDDDGSCEYEAFCFVDCDNVVVNSAFMFGAPCDDNNPNTIISYMDNCACVGLNIVIDCAIEPQKPNVIIGEAYCLLVTVRDTLSGDILANTPVNFLVSGANEGLYDAAYTDAFGQVELCYTPTNPGLDFISVTSGNFNFTFGNIVFDFGGGTGFDLNWLLSFGHVYNGSFSVNPPEEIPVNESLCTTITITDEEGINVIAGVEVTIISTIEGYPQITVDTLITTNLSGQIEFCPSSLYAGIEECIITSPFSTDTIRYNWVADFVPCDPEPGLMQTSNTYVCAEDFAYFAEAFSIVPQGYTRAYVLHQEETFDGSNFMMMNKQGRFESLGEGHTNKKMYVSAVIGLPDSNNMPQMFHECTVWTPYGAQVIFLEPVSVLVQEESCAGNLYDVEISLRGGIGELSPFSAYLTVTDGTTTYHNVSRDDVLTFGPYHTNNSYTIAIESAKGCSTIWSSNTACTPLVNLQHFNYADLEVLMFDNHQPGVAIQAVSIFNAYGQQVPAHIQLLDKQCIIKFNKAAKGIYLAQLQLNNGATEIVKLVK